MPTILVSHNESETQQLAISIAMLAYAVDCITLTGDLGTGKTIFARALIQTLAGNITVQSPTFMLVLPYTYVKDGAPRHLHHFDLYRIKHAEELQEIGLEEALGSSLCLIEWPAIAEAYLPSNRLDIRITQLADNERRFELIAKGNWQDRLNKVYFSS